MGEWEEESLERTLARLPEHRAYLERYLGAVSQVPSLDAADATTDVREALGMIVRAVAEARTTLNLPEAGTPAPSADPDRDLAVVMPHLPRLRHRIANVLNEIEGCLHIAQAASNRLAPEVRSRIEELADRTAEARERFGLDYGDG